MLWIFIVIGIVFLVLGLTVFIETEACVTLSLAGCMFAFISLVLSLSFFSTYFNIKNSNPKKIEILEQNNIEIIKTVKEFEIDSIKLDESTYKEFVSRQLDILAKNNEEIKKLKLELNDLAMYKVLLFLPDTNKERTND